MERLNDQRFVEKELYSQIKVGDIILLSIRLPYFFGVTPLEDNDVNFYREDGSFLSRENFFDEWTVSVINLAKMVQKYDTKVIIQTPTPEWEKEENKFCSLLT